MCLTQSGKGDESPKPDVKPMPEVKTFRSDDDLREYIEKSMSSLNGLIEYSYEECIDNILLYQRTWDAINKVIPTAKASLKEDWATTRFLDPDFASTKMIGRINNLQIVAALLLTISVANLFADNFDPAQAVGIHPDDYPYDVDSVNYARGCLNFISTIFFSCTIMFGAIFTDMMSRFYTQSEQYVAVVKFYPWSIFTIVMPTWVGIAVMYATFCIEIGIRSPRAMAIPLGLFGLLFFVLFIYFLLQANSTASLSQARLYNTFTRLFCDQANGRVRKDILDFAKREFTGMESNEKQNLNVTMQTDLLRALLGRDDHDGRSAVKKVTTLEQPVEQPRLPNTARHEVVPPRLSEVGPPRLSVSEIALQCEPHFDNPLHVHRRSDLRKL